MNTQPSSATGTLPVSLAVLFIPVLLAGCATSREFSLDAVRRTDIAVAPHLSYRLVASPSAHREGVSPLAAERIRRDVRTALSSKGLYEAPAGVPPALEVEIDFGLEGPVQRELSHTEPVYVMVPSAPRMSGHAGADDFGSSPRQRKLGERTVTTTVLLYTKFLRLTAREARASPAEVPAPALWSVVVTNEDESDDLVRYTRLMAAAAMDYIGEQSREGQTILLTYADGRVRFIEAGM